MNRLTIALIGSIIFNTSLFADSENSLPTTETLHLNGKVKTQKSYKNGSMFQEMNFREDGRLISDIVYSQKGSKHNETKVTYDANGNVLNVVKCDYTLKVPKKSDWGEGAIVDGDTYEKARMWDYAPDLLEKHIIYWESYSYNENNQVVSSAITSKEPFAFTRHKYLFEYDKNGLKTSQKHYSFDLGDSDTSYYELTVWEYDKDKRPTLEKLYKGKDGTDSRLSETTTYSYNSKGLLTERTTMINDTTCKAKTQISYFSNGQKMMVIETRRKMERKSAVGRIPWIMVTDTVEIYDKKGHNLLRIGNVGRRTCKLRFEYDKKGNLTDKFDCLGHTQHSYTNKGVKTESRIYSSFGKENDAPIIVKTYDSKGRIIKSVLWNGEVTTIEYDNNDFIKVVQTSDSSISDRMYGHQVSEIKVLDKDKTSVKDVYNYEYDSMKNLLKSPSKYGYGNKYVYEYYK